MKKRRGIITGVMVWVPGLVLAAWVYSNFPTGQFVSVFLTLDILDVLVWSAVNLAIILIYVQRWRILILSTGQQCSFISLLYVRQAGQLVSFLTPGPQFGGEPLQLFWLYNRYHLEFTSALSGLLLDRIYAVGVNIAVLLLAISLLITGPWLIGSDLILICLFLLAVLAGLGLFVRALIHHPASIRALISRQADRWQHHSVLRSIEIRREHLSVLFREIMTNRHGALATALLWSVLGWGGMLVELWWMVRLSGLTPGYQEYILIFVAVRLAFLLPVPGGIGTVEAAVLWAFQLSGFSAGDAVTLLALMRLRDIVVLFGGWLAFVRLGYKNIQSGRS